jgi:hypothetical protein
MKKRQLKEMTERIQGLIDIQREDMLKQEISGTDNIATFIECLEIALKEKNEERIYQECLNLDEFSQVSLSDIYTDYAHV